MAYDPTATLRAALEARERSALQRAMMQEAMRGGDVLPMSALGGASSLDDAVVSRAMNGSAAKPVGVASQAQVAAPKGPLHGPFRTPAPTQVTQVAEAMGGQVAGATDDVARAGIMQQIRGAASSAGSRGLTGVLTRAGAQEGAGALARTLGRPMVARGLAGGVGTLAAAPVGLGVDMLNIGGEGSNWDALASGAASGAVAGGVMGGPWGALAGAAIGGGASVLMNELFSANEAEDPKTIDEQITTITGAAARVGVQAEAVAAIRDRYTMRTEMALAMDPEADADEVRRQNLLLMQEELMNAAEAESIARQERAALEADPSYMTPQEQQVANAYTQAMIGAYIKPYADEMIASGDAAAAGLEQLAGSSGHLGPILRNQAQQERANSARMAGGLMSSAIAEPWLQAARRQQSAIDQQAQQLTAQAMGMVNQQRMGGGGGSSTADILAGLTG